jgi:hypothetical protein
MINALFAILSVLLILLFFVAIISKNKKVEDYVDIDEIVDSTKDKTIPYKRKLIFSLINTLSEKDRQKLVEKINTLYANNS